MVNSEAKVLLTIFVGIIMFVVLIDVTADQVSDVTNTLTNVNETITAPTLNSKLAITGRTLIGTAAVTNGSAQVNTTNYTITTGLINGVATVIYTNLDASWNSVSVNVSYSFEPEGYVREASSRAMVLLVVLFGSLAIVIFIVTRLMKEGLLKQLMRKR